MLIPGPGGFIRRAEAGPGLGERLSRLFVSAPFHQLAGQERQREESNSIPSPSPSSSSICTAELDGPATMWRATLRLFLLFLCCVRWCRAEGKALTFFDFSSPELCQLNGSLGNWVHLLLTHKSLLLQRNILYFNGCVWNCRREPQALLDCTFGQCNKINKC